MRSGSGRGQEAGPVTEAYQGEVGVGDGWWLVLPEPFAGGLDEDGGLVFERPTMVLFPQTVSYDPASTDVPVSELVQDIADETVAGTPASAEGPIQGVGWSGQLLREVIDHAGGEHQLIGCLGAPGFILNLTVRYLGPENEEAARALLLAVRHVPEDVAEMNAQLSGTGA